MQQRLKENQELAKKNTKLRTYLLKGMVGCAACRARYSGVTIRRRGKEYSYYICSARLKRRSEDERCQSPLPPYPEGRCSSFQSPFRMAL